MLSSLSDITRIIDAFTLYLEKEGCSFNGQGFPFFERSWFLEEEPDQMVTYRDRNNSYITQKDKTLLCFYCSDNLIYPRLERVFDELPEYKKYMGTVGADITVTEDMDIEWQEAIMLLNLLFTAVLAINGIKVVLNMRCGLPKTLRCFNTIPTGITCASGTLGCSVAKSPLDVRYLEKLFTIRPSKVFIYGKHDRIMEGQLDLAGVPYKLFRDAHFQKKQARGIAPLTCG